MDRYRTYQTTRAIAASEQSLGECVSCRLVVKVSEQTLTGCQYDFLSCLDRARKSSVIDRNNVYTASSQASFSLG